MRENVKRKRGASLEEANADKATRFEDISASDAVRFGVKGE